MERGRELLRLRYLAAGFAKLFEPIKAPLFQRWLLFLRCSEELLRPVLPGSPAFSRASTFRARAFGPTLGPILLSKVAERDRETEQRAEKLRGEKRRQVGPFILRFRGKRARLNLLQIDAPFSLSFQTSPKMPTLDRYDRSRFDTFLVQEVKKFLL